MATPTHHWKLGLFVVIGLGLALAAVLLLAARSLTTSSSEYTTYYDESVQGLEIGAPVKFRGVTVGAVVGLGIAPDKRHVEVHAELETAQLGALGLAGPEHTRIPGLRVQLASQGITGVRFLQIDLFDEDSFPRPVLPFPEPAHYLPAAISTMKSVEDSVVTSVARLPEMIDAILHATTQLSQIMDDLEAADLGRTAAVTLARMDRVLAAIDRKLATLDLGALARKADRVLDRLDGDHGLLASLGRSSNAVAELARGELRGDFAETLRTVRETGASFTRLADALERDPDMLIKGRTVRP